MSHISVMKIAFADRELLKRALADLGYETEQGDDLRITNGVKTVKVDFLVKVPYTDSIGFRKGGLVPCEHGPETIRKPAETALRLSFRKAVSRKSGLPGYRGNTGRKTADPSCSAADCVLTERNHGNK